MFYINNDSPRFAGDIQGNIQTAILTIDGKNYSAAVDRDTKTWEVPAGTISPLADGVYDVTARFYSFGTSFRNRVDVQVTIDTQAPGIEGDTVNLIGFDDDDGLINNTEKQNVSLSATLEPESTLDSLVIRDEQDNEVVVAEDDITIDANGNVSVAGQDLSGLSDGQLTTVMTVTDRAGNTGTIEAQAQLDTSAEAGTVSIDSLTADNVISAAEAEQTITVSGTATGGDISAGDTVSTTVNGVDYSDTVQANGSWSLAVAGADLATATSLDVSVSSRDAAGNAVSSLGSTTYEVSTEAPTSTLVFNDGGDGLVNSTDQDALALSGSTDPGTTIDSLIISDGNTQFAVPENEILLDSQGDIQVNAQDVSGLDDGPLTATLTVTDSVGNTSSVTATTTLDTQAPGGAGDSTNAIRFDDDNGTLNASEQGSATLSGTLEADASLTSLEVTDGQGGRVNVDLTGITPDASGDFTVSGVDLTDLNDGTLTATLGVTDEAGNTGSVTDTITLSTTGPEGTSSIAFDDGGDGLVSAAEEGSVTLSGAIDSTATVASLVITDGGTGSITVDPSDIQVVDGNVSVNGQNLSSLADGDLTATLTVTDSIGNTGSVTATTTLDTQAPGGADDSTNAISFDDVDGTLNATEQTNASFSGTLEAGATADSLVISDGNTTNDITVAAADISVDTDGNVSVSGVDLTGLSDGTLTATLNVTDEAGNTGSVDNTITLNTTGPDSGASIAFDDGNGYINESEQGTVTLSGTVQTDVNIDNLIITDGNGIDVTVASGDISIDTNGNITVSAQNLAGLAEGELKATLKLSDNIGNTASVTATTILDTQAPGGADDSTNAISFDDDNGSLNATEQGSATLKGTLEADASLTSLEVTDGQGGRVNVDLTGITPDASGNFTVSGVDLTDLNDGTLTATLGVTDKAGNTGSVTDTITLSTTGPEGTSSIAFDDGGDGLVSAAEQGSVTLSGAIDPAATVDSLVITDSGSGNISVDSADITVTNGNVTVTGQNLGSLADGDLTATLTVTDSIGNTGSVTATTTLDTQAPGGADDSTNAISFDDVDGTLNATEQTNASFSGTLEAGATADSLVISDGDSATDDITVDPADISVDVDGNVSVSGVDLTGLNDGTLTATLNVTDEAGNTGSVSDTITLTTTGAETGASIAFDDGNGYINESEQGAMTLSGNLPTGRSVDSLVISDAFGRSVTVAADSITADSSGNLSVAAQRLSGLLDGELTATLTVTDSTGNTGSVTDTSILDTSLPGGADDSTNTIGFDDNDDVLNATEQANANFTGTLEAGATADSLVISDEDGTTDDITVAAGNISVGTNGSVSVSGVDLTGLSDGTLTATLNVTDEAGNTGSVTDTITLNTAGPGDSGDTTTTIAFDDGGDGLVNASEQGSVTLSGAIDPAATVDSLVITDSSTGSIPVDSADITVTNGTVTVTGQDLSTLADGDLTATLTVTDSIGNTGSVTATTTLDTQAPGNGDTANTIGFDDNDDVLNATEQTNANFSGTLEAGATADSLVISDGDSATNDITVAAADISVDTDGNVSVSNVDLTSLSDGTLTATLNVTDEAGNTGSVSDTITLTTTGAETGASIAFDDGNGYINESEQGAVTLSGNLPTGRSVDSLVISDAFGRSVTVAAESITDDGSGNLSVAAQRLSGLLDGELTATLTVTDSIGNTGSVTATTTLDTQAPGNGDTANTIGFDDNDDVLNATEQTSANFTGTLETGATADSLVISDGDSATNDITVAAADISVGTDGNVSVSGVDLTGLSDGTLTATLNVTDEAGNTGSVTDTITLNTAGPGDSGDTITTIAFDDDLVNASEQGSVTLSGAIDPAATVDSLVITDSGSGNIPVGSADITVTNGTVTVTGQNLSSLADGDLTATLTVTDSIGNTGSVTATTTLDTQAPGNGDTANTIGFDDNDDVLNATEQTNASFSGTLEAGATADSLVISDGDSATNDITVAAADISVDTDGNVSVSNVDLTGLSDGTLTATLNVTDEAGNTGSVSDTITLNTTGPGDTGDSITTIAFDDGGDGFINISEQDSVTLSGAIDPAATVDSLVITDSNDTNITVPSTAITVGTDGTVTVDPQSVTGLSDGPLTATLTVTDSIGNTGSVTATTTLDTQAPGNGDTANTIGFDDNDDVLNATEQTSANFTGTLETGATADSLVISDGDSATNDITVAAADISVGTDGNVSVSGVDLTGLSDGTLTATLNVTDEAGNTGSVTDTITLNTTGPGDSGDTTTTIAFDDGGDGLVNASEQGSVTLSGAIDPAATVDSLVITDSGSGNISVDSADITVTNGNVTVTGQNLGSLADGDLTATLTVTDSIGNTGSVTATTTLDTQAPSNGDTANTIGFDDNDDVLNATEQTNASFSGTLEAGATADSLVISDGDSATNDITVAAADISVDTDGNVSVSNVDLTGLSDGTLTATLNVTDEAGNTGSVTDTITLDTTGPGDSGDTITTIAFDDGGDGFINISEQDSVTLSGAIDPDATVDSLVITDSSDTKITVPSTAITVGVDGTVTVAPQNVTGLSDGLLTATLTVTDSIGNTGSVTAQSELDATPPSDIQAALEEDTGDTDIDGSFDDGETTNGIINVTGLDAGSTWFYQETTGGPWIEGTGESFELLPPDFDATEEWAVYQPAVKQVDPAGNESAIFDFSGIYPNGEVKVAEPSGEGGFDSIGPVVLDLNGDGDLEYHQVAMDVNRDGQTNLTSWAGPGDGVVVWDKHADGTLTDMDQYAFTEFGGKTDLEGLAVGFDSNEDGVFDANDDAFAEFGVWQDANANGAMDAGEFQNLSDLGITSINLVSDGVEQTPYEGVQEFGRGTAVKADGSEILLADAAFQYTNYQQEDDSSTSVI